MQKKVAYVCIYHLVQRRKIWRKCDGFQVHIPEICTYWGFLSNLVCEVVWLYGEYKMCIKMIEISPVVFKLREVNKIDYLLIHINNTLCAKHTFLGCWHMTMCLDICYFCICIQSAFYNYYTEQKHPRCKNSVRPREAVL